MGGKPQKPKIQAYVDRQWHEEFESYRQQHGLNQSQALGKILAGFFGSKQSLSPAQSEASKQLVALDERLRIVEARLASESAEKTANNLTVSLDGLANELANRLAGGVSESGRPSTINPTQPAVEPAEGVIPPSTPLKPAKATAPIAEGTTTKISEIMGVNFKNLSFAKQAGRVPYRSNGFVAEPTGEKKGVAVIWRLWRESDEAPSTSLAPDVSIPAPPAPPAPADAEEKTASQIAEIMRCSFQSLARAKKEGRLPYRRNGFVAAPTDKKIGRTLMWRIWRDPALGTSD